MWSLRAPRPYECWLRGLHSVAGFYVGQRAYRRGVERGAVNRELRAVTRTIPARLERIPMQMTANVCACRRSGVQDAVLVTIGGDLAQALSHDRALAGLEAVQ